MKTLPRCGIIGIAVLLLGGCSNNQRFSYSFKSDQRHVTITTQPTNASVFQRSFVDNSLISLGKTPLKAVPVTVLTGAKFSKTSPSRLNNTYRHLNSVVVLIEKDGYEPYSGPLRADPNETVEHHITLVPQDA
jgi:hypothetical protein